MMPPRSFSLLFSLLTLGAMPAHAGDLPGAASTPLSLTGTWELVAAEKQQPDGTTRNDYGLHPSGRMIVDAKGRYILHISNPARPNFASGDRAKGTEAEYRAASLGLSTHFGTVKVEDGLLVFRIEDASFPNRRGAVQRRRYDYKNGVLSYRVPPRPDGSIPVSVWKRMD